MAITACRVRSTVIHILIVWLLDVIGHRSRENCIKKKSLFTFIISWSFIGNLSLIVYISLVRDMNIVMIAREAQTFTKPIIIATATISHLNWATIALVTWVFSIARVFQRCRERYISHRWYSEFMSMISFLSQSATYLCGASVLSLDVLWFEKIWMNLISNIGVDVDVQAI
jgi:hypothetical protein